MRALLGVTAASAALLGAAAALASAPPVGPLPKGPTVVIAAKAGTVFVVKLPSARGSALVWRVARRYDASVVREIREGDTTTYVWVRFRAVEPGRTTIVFARTRGETAHAYAARSFSVTVR